jgi:dihydroflavonol-4-reductase
MTSSIAAIAYGRSERAEPSSEADWTDEKNRNDTSAYERSKTIAERAPWAWHKAEGGALELVTVNPAFVLGPVLGSDFSPSLEVIKKLMDRSVPALPRLGFSLVDVRDIAKLHLVAMTAPGASGQRFIGSSDFYWMKDIAKVLKQELGDNTSGRATARQGCSMDDRRSTSRRDPDRRYRQLSAKKSCQLLPAFRMGKRRSVQFAK